MTIFPFAQVESEAVLNLLEISKLRFTLTLLYYKNASKATEEEKYLQNLQSEALW